MMKLLKSLQHDESGQDLIEYAILAFFIALAAPYASLTWSPDLSECHVPGRHLNALLMAEAVAGVPVDPAAIDIHRLGNILPYRGATG